MMSSEQQIFRDITTGVLYRNPMTHVKSIHAYFPSVAVLPGGEMLATVVLGEAFESVNLRTHVARSRDGGERWELEGTLYPGTPDRLTSDASRIAALPDGEVVAFMVRHDRGGHPEEGLGNPETLGFVPTELLLLRSADGGHAWSDPQPIIPPLAGPSFELCSPITPLSDGRWLLPTSTWAGWNGECPSGWRTVALVSRDRGESWPEFVDVMYDPAQQAIYWESKIVELPDGRLFAIAWGYDRIASKDFPNQYAVSADGGRTWTPPRSMGLFGQTMTPCLLADGRILCVYRRIDEPGLWAAIVRLEGVTLVIDGQQPLWGHGWGGLTGSSANMIQNFTVLRFGAPCLTRLADDSIFLTFWAYEDCVSNIRWIRMRI
ncbi:MAG: sialidase family protein [Armatimonadota bacterium]